jgi:anti-sigma factor RsiW
MDHRHDDRVRRLMMAALDGESTPDERAELERLLAVDAELMTQWNRLVALKEVTNSMTMKKPPEEVWDRYWTDLYPRLERGIGWILLSLGAVVVVAYGAWEGLRALWYDPELPVLVKGGILVGIVGAAVLLVSVAREKIFLHQSDRYKDILR